MPVRCAEGAEAGGSRVSLVGLLPGIVTGPCTGNIYKDAVVDYLCPLRCMRLSPVSHVMELGGSCWAMRNEINILKDEAPESCFVSSTKWGHSEGFLPSMTQEMGIGRVPALLTL